MIRFINFLKKFGHTHIEDKLMICIMTSIPGEPEECDFRDVETNIYNVLRYQDFYVSTFAINGDKLEVILTEEPS